MIRSCDSRAATMAEAQEETHRQILLPCTLPKFGVAYSAQMYISRNISCPWMFSGSFSILTCGITSKTVGVSQATRGSVRVEEESPLRP